MVIRNVLRWGSFVVAGVGLLALVACGQTSEARRRAAQVSADRYFERIKAGEYEAAYKDTFSSAHRDALSIEDFVRYRRGLAAWTGKIGGYHVVAYKPESRAGRIELTYALEAADPARASPSAGTTYEIVQLVEENGEWRIASLDVNRTAASDGGQSSGHGSGDAQRPK
jgi:hypothetical protein